MIQDPGERFGQTAIAGVTSGVMRLGDEVTWRARHFGIPFVMTSRISELTAPDRFVDEQVHGPFARWWHEHCFAAKPGGTLMTDNVDFESPAGLLGVAANRLVLTRYLTGLLSTRNAWLTRSLASQRDV